MKIKQWQVKGFTIQIKILCDFLKIKLLFFNSSSSIMYILLNNSNIDYFWHNVFNTVS